MCNLMVNNTTVAPNGSTSRTDPDGTCWPMAGSEGHPEQTQCSELTTSDPFGNPTTSTAYSNSITTTLCNSYTTTNDTATAITLPDTMFRYSWYSNLYVMTLATAYPPRPTTATTISYWYNKLLHYHTTIDTARLRYDTPLCYSIIINTTGYPVSLLLWYNNPICQYTPIDTASY